MRWKISFTVKMILSRFVLFGLLLAVSIANAEAADSAIHDNRPIAISAEEAFDAFADQIDPKSGESARVVIVDIRTKAEYFWVGTSGKVDKIITTSNNVIIPDKGKVKFFFGSYIQTKRSGLILYLPISRISQMLTSPIAINIPCLNWNAENCQLEKNENFAFEIQSLSNFYDVVILMCRSGGRTSACYLEFDNGLFKSVYEIDDSFIGGTGGFQGSSFNNAFNGYRGFPGRNRSSFGDKPVSWSDSGLPVHLGYCDF